MHGSSGVRYSFLLGSIAVTVGHWVQPDPEGDEHGARVEIQRMHETQDRPFWEFKEITLREPIWRADLFTWDGGKPGNWDRAHHHVDWNDMEPADREWEDDLKRDPVAWTERQLANIDKILQRGGSADLVQSVSQADVDTAKPHIIEAVRRCMTDELRAASVKLS
jgi:hypothetical protein